MENGPCEYYIKNVTNINLNEHYTTIHSTFFVISYFKSGFHFIKGKSQEAHS